MGAAVGNATTSSGPLVQHQVHRLASQRPVNSVKQSAVSKKSRQSLQKPSTSVLAVAPVPCPSAASELHGYDRRTVASLGSASPFALISGPGHAFKPLSNKRFARQLYREETTEDTGAYGHVFKPHLCARSVLSGACHSACAAHSCDTLELKSTVWSQLGLPSEQKRGRWKEAGAHEPLTAVGT